jgi:fatty-acyl-CoA synthase
VPTIWLGIIQALEKEPTRWDISSLREMLVGGSAAPQAMIAAFQKRHGIRIVHGWGMTEMSPVGSLCRLNPEMETLPEEERFRILATQGPPLPFVDMRIVSDQGPVPWDGRTMGALHVRGPWIARSYFNSPPDPQKFTPDGWLNTGDIATIDADGFLRITDRAKDLIKSGGEWISSVDLENAIMGHPAVKEAAVVAVKHPKWGERPVACVVLKEGARATEQELRAYLEPVFARFWLPDAFVFMSELPRTATGKFLKMALREQLGRAFEGWGDDPRTSPAPRDGGTAPAADATVQG